MSSHEFVRARMEKYHEGFKHVLATYAQLRGDDPDPEKNVLLKRCLAAAEESHVEMAALFERMVRDVPPIPSPSRN